MKVDSFTFSLMQHMSARLLLEASNTFKTWRTRPQLQTYSTSPCHLLFWQRHCGNSDECQRHKGAKWFHFCYVYSLRTIPSPEYLLLTHKYRALVHFHICYSNYWSKTDHLVHTVLVLLSGSLRATALGTSLMTLNFKTFSLPGNLMPPIPFTSTVSQDIKASFAKCRVKIGKLLKVSEICDSFHVLLTNFQDYFGCPHFATTAWTLLNH